MTSRHKRRPTTATLVADARQNGPAKTAEKGNGASVLQDRTAIGLAAILVAATVVAYWPTFFNGFVFDDRILIVSNICTNAPDGLYRLWFTAENYEYLPLTYSVFWFERQVFGNDPLGFHVLSVLLQAANALLLWRLLVLIGVPGAWWGSLLFAVHPVASSSVCWASEQKNLWALFFALLTAICYVRFRADGRRLDYMLSIICFIAALLGKTSVVMLPFLLLCYDTHLRGRCSRQDIVRTSPFFLTSLILGLVTVWFQFHRGIGDSRIAIGNYWERWMGAGYAAWFYLGKTLAPVQLSLIYPRWNYSDLTPWPSLLLLVLMTTVWRYRARNRWLAATARSLGSFFIVLLPVLGFVPMAFMRFSLVSDHFAYPALPAIAALIGSGIAWLNSISRLGIPLGALTNAALALLTMEQAFNYRDDETLWRRTVSENPSAKIAYSNLAWLFTERGDHEEAIKFFAIAVQLDASDANERGLYGNALLRTGNWAGAEEQFREAIRLKPDDEKAHNNLARTLLQQGRAREALVEARRAVELAPHLAHPHYNFARALNDLKQFAEAAEEARLAIQIDPKLPGAHFQKGIADLGLGNRDQAIDAFRRVLTIEPDNQEARAQLKYLQAR